MPCNFEEDQVLPDLFDQEEGVPQRMYFINNTI